MPLKLLCPNTCFFVKQDGDEDCPPSDIVCLRNLPQDTTNADLKYLLQGWSNYLEDARCAVTHGGPNAPCKGFAFLTFVHLDYAKQFIANTQGKMVVRGQMCRLVYSRHHKMESSSWLCASCQRLNYSHRPKCHFCSTAQPETPNIYPPSCVLVAEFVFSFSPTLTPSVSCCNTCHRT